VDTKVLFEEYREDILECVHHGTVCVVNKDGIAAAVGDPGWICYYRSASKPIQSLPVLMHGLDLKYGLTEEETALFSGSHWGDQEHVRVLEAIMQKTGLKEEQMIMLPTYPNRISERNRLIENHMPPRKIYHNCSGKHLGMMLLARELGEEVTGYWKRESRTQQEILGIISMMTDVAQEDIKTGVDGCGVPVYAVPFHSIATSYLRLVCPELIPDSVLRTAVIKNVNMIHKYPHMIAGKDIVCSVLASSSDLLGKSGALGVYVIGIRSLGVGAVVKIMDGSHDEFAAAVLRVFEELGYNNREVAEKLEGLYPSAIVNDNKEMVGHRKAVFKLFEK